MARNFKRMLEERWSQGKFVCVGLDSDFAKIPKSAHVREARDKYTTFLVFSKTIIGFNYAIVEATKDLVCAYKLNLAFYEAYGTEGIDILEETISDIRNLAPKVPVILDAKFGDTFNTNKGYVKFAFDHLRADAVTVHPYMGGESLEPFFVRKNNGIFVLCRTSNPGAGEFQDRNVEVRSYDEAKRLKIDSAISWYMNGGGVGDSQVPTIPLWSYVAHSVAHAWNKNGNCGLVVGATFPDKLGRVRKIVGDMPILIPGIGAQGGDLEKTVKAGKDSRGQGMIINSSRGIVFASRRSTFAEAARRETEKLHNLINQYRNEV